MLEEQRENAVNTCLLAKVTGDLSDKITGIEGKMAGLKITAPEPDLELVKDLLKKHFQMLRALIDAQPKEVRQVKQIMLFPIESFKQDFYLNAISKILKCVIILTITLVVIYKGDIVCFYKLYKLREASKIFYFRKDLATLAF